MPRRFRKAPGSHPAFHGQVRGTGRRASQPKATGTPDSAAFAARRGRASAGNGEAGEVPDTSEQPLHLTTLWVFATPPCRQPRMTPLPSFKSSHASRAPLGEPAAAARWPHTATMGHGEVSAGPCAAKAILDVVSSPWRNSFPKLLGVSVPDLPHLFHLPLSPCVPPCLGLFPSRSLQIRRSRVPGFLAGLSGFGDSVGTQSRPCGILWLTMPSNSGVLCQLYRHGHTHQLGWPKNKRINK